MENTSSDNLELYGNVDEKHVVYGYRVKVSEIPSQYGVTKFLLKLKETRVT